MESWINKENEFTVLLNQWKSSSKFKSYTFEEIMNKLPSNEKVIVQLKVDGELVLFTYNKERNLSQFVSLGGRVWQDLPVLDELQEKLEQFNIESANIIGELGAVRDGKILSFNEILSVVRKPVDEKEIHFFPFELESVDNEELQKGDYLEGFENLKLWFSDAGFITPVKTWCVTKEKIPSIWSKVLSDDLEGIVIRSDSLGILKVKPEFSLDLAVGFVRRSDKNPDEMGSLGLFFRDLDGRFLFTSRVGTGFSKEDRRTWLRWGEENEITTEGRDLWVNPLKPGRVVEIRYGKINPKKVDTYTFGKNQWARLKEKNPAATLSKPVFVRIRDDKAAKDIDDVRLEQIPDWEEKKEKIAQSGTPWPPDHRIPFGGVDEPVLVVNDFEKIKKKKKRVKERKDMEIHSRELTADWKDDFIKFIPKYVNDVIMDKIVADFMRSKPFVTSEMLGKELGITVEETVGSPLVMGKPALVEASRRLEMIDGNFVSKIQELRARITKQGIGKKQREEVLEKFEEWAGTLAEELDLAISEIHKAIKEHYEEEEMAETVPSEDAVETEGVEDLEQMLEELEESELEESELEESEFEESESELETPESD